jgi:hypothetical protein
MANESVVKSRAGSIMAESAVMLLVGFYFFGGRLGGSTPSDYAAFATVWTFRAGGIALVVVGMLCLSGRRGSLMANAILDLVIGLVFTVSGAILLIDGGPSGLLIALFGLMSLGSARWDWNAWRSVRSTVYGAGPASQAEPVDVAWRPVDETEPDVPAVDADRAAGRAEALKRIVEQKRGIPRATPREDSPAIDDPEGAASPDDRHGNGRQSSTPPSAQSARPQPRADEPPPEGFLADFGRDEPEDK